MEINPSSKIKICPNCGKEFEANPYHLQKFCSLKCRIEFNKINKKELIKSAAKNYVTCPICKKKFKPHHSNVKYCSKACRRAGDKRRAANRNKIYYQQLMPITNCIECGKPFRPKSTRNVFCSFECRYERIRRREKETTIAHSKLSTNNAQYDLTCQVCGRHFTSSTPFVKFCSDQCREKFRDDSWLAAQVNDPINPMLTL